jgi:hypothetical protein
MRGTPRPRPARRRHRPQRVPAPGHGQLEPADIRAASNGNADYATTRLARTGRWLHLAATSVRLKPHATRRVAYTVRVPATAHYAGIVAVDAVELAAAAGRPRKDRSFTFNRVNRQALPLTVRLAGPRARSLSLRALGIKVEPAGAGLVLGLLPGGSELIANAAVKLRVLRGSHTILTHASTLGQLFPGARLNFRIPWAGRPTKGAYRVKGVIRPERAAPIFIDQTIQFTPAKASQLDRETTPGSRRSGTPETPLWMWFALGGAGALVLFVLLLLWKLRRRSAEQPA